jgi:sugar phosphate isomerase/epimerase
VELALGPGSAFAIDTLDGLDTYAGAAAAAGFRAVSLVAACLPADVGAAATVLDRHGLRCTDLMTLTVTRDEDATLAAARALRPAVDALGPDAVLTLVWTRVSEESVDRLGRMADVLGVPLALEFSPGPVPTLDAALDLAQALGPRRATLLADTFHFFRGGSTWAMLETAPPDRIGIVQFTDALPSRSEDYLAETANRRAWPGDGEFPLERFATTLRNRGWDGVVSVEVLSERLRGLPVEEFARLAHRSTAAYWR